MPLIKVKKCLNCGVAHEWLFDGATLKELRMIKQLTGMNARQFAAAGDDMDPDALAALVYILHKRIKINLPDFNEIDIDFKDFSMEPTEEEKKELEELEKRMESEAANGEAPKASLNGNGKTAEVASNLK